MTSSFYKIYVLAFAMAVLLFALPGCKNDKPETTETKQAAALEKSARRGAVDLTVRITPKDPLLSDLLTMEVIVNSPADVEVKPPPFGKSVGEFIVRDYLERPVQADGELRIRKFNYKLEPVRTGPHLIKSIGVEFIDRRAATEAKPEPIYVETEPIEITVKSEFGDAAPNLNSLSPMSAPVPLPAKPFPLWMIAAVAAAALAGTGLFVAWRFRGKSHVENIVNKTPEEIAREELNALLAENLPGKGQYKEFYLRITGIVRRYIERTTGIHAPEQTTEEFLRDKRFREVFPLEKAERLASFLEAADLVKYAGMQPGQRQIEETVARAQEFVGLSSALSPLPVKG